MTKISLDVRKLVVAGVAFVVVVFVAVLAASAGRAEAVGPNPAPMTEAGTVTCDTDADGYCAVAHSLGVVPESVLLTPGLRQNMPYLLGVAAKSEATVDVRAVLANGQPIANDTIEFSYAVFAPAASPPSTSTTSGTCQPGTTTTTTTTSPDDLMAADLTTTTTVPAKPCTTTTTTTG